MSVNRYVRSTTSARRRANPVDEGYTGQTYDVSNPEARQALREAFEESSAFEQFEYDPAEIIGKLELRAAQTELFDRLKSAGFKCRRFTRDRNFRCDLPGARIAIEDPYLEAEILNMGDEQIPAGLNAVVDAYNEWTIPHSLNVEMRVHEALLPTLEAWLSENQIRIVGGTARAIYDLDDEVDQEAAVDAEVELRQRALDERLAVAEAERDSTAIGEIEAEKSALAHAHAEFKVAAEAGDTIDPSDPDEDWSASVGEPRDRSMETSHFNLDPSVTKYELAPHVLAALRRHPDEPTDEEEFERIIESIGIEEKAEALVQSLYDDLKARGLGRYADDSIVRVNRLNGEVYLPSGVEGYLEGIALPFGLTFDERRGFVKAIKTFEERKYDMNKEVLAELVRWGRFDEGYLLGMNGVPQFTVREDYLNTYVERAQPGEIPALEHAVERALADFEAEPTKEKVFNLKPMIESLFRYDPAKPKYHEFLDRMCEAGDAVPLWAESVRRKMPLIERTQSKAASVYSEEGYVPVIEDPLAGLDVFARNVARFALRFAQDEYSEYYGFFDPDMYLEFFEDQGAGVADTYLSYKGLEDLTDCARGREYILEYGNFDRPTMDHRYATRAATSRETVNLEYLAKSIFDNISEVYDMYAFAADLEVVVGYGDKVSVDFVAEDPNTIVVVFGSRITQLDIDFAYALLCEYIAEVIVTQEPDLDPEDANLDGADILNLMRIPKPPRRLKTSSVRDIMRVFDDLEAISKYTQSGEFDQDLEDLRDLYEECMGMPVGAWDLSQYVGETAEEANERRKTFAALIGLNPYLPYDISIALDDDDYADLSRAVQYALREALTTFDETEEDVIFELVRRRVRDAYRAIVFPKYFPEDKVRVVHVTYREADDFTRKHHSLQGGDDKEINPRGLELTIGAEVDGKLVAVATANSVSSGFKHQETLTDLSRVASDGSVKGVSSLLAGIVLKLTLENKFNRKPSLPPRFITYSTLDEVGSTYMALLGMGLRPTHLSPPGTPGGARKGSKIGDVYKHYKLRWEAGESAEPANLDLARFLKMSYASDLEKDNKIAKVGEPWGDDYICICILNTVRFSMFCAEYVKTLKESFTPWPTSAETRRIRRELLKAAPTQIARSDRRRVKNIEKFLKPFQICDEIEGTSPVTQEGRKIIVRCILAIKGRISETDTPDGCSKSEMIADLTTYEKSLPTFKKKKR